MSANSIASPPRPDPPRLIIEEKNGDLVYCSLDFGAYEVRGARGNTGAQYPSMRLPASVGKNGRGRPELDFVDPVFRKAAVRLLLAEAGNALTQVSWPVPKKSDPRFRLARLEKVSQSGSSIAEGELWFDDLLAVRFKLMPSRWSRVGWWVAYPASWNPKTNRWDLHFIIKDRSLKKKVAIAIRQEFQKRFGEDDSGP